MKTAWQFEDALMAANRSLEGLGGLKQVGEHVIFYGQTRGTNEYRLSICNHLTKAGMLRLLDELHGWQTPMILAPYISKEIALELKKADICFADSAGNVFLKGEALLIWHVGEKPVLRGKPDAIALGTRAFQATGMKFLYELLIRDPGLIDGTYRELNALTGVSLGAIGWILRSLKENGFLMEIDGQRRLTNKRELLNEWCTAYHLKLRPKYLMGKYRLRNQQKMLEVNLPPGSLWGGEVAAAKLAGIIRPELGTLYVDASINLCMAKLGLLEDLDGNIELLRAFWQETPETEKTVPPLLIYADLMTSGSSRNAEAARGIYDKYLADIFS